MPSSAAPCWSWSRGTWRAKPLSFIFLRTAATSTSSRLRLGRTSATAGGRREGRLGQPRHLPGRHLALLDDQRQAFALRAVDDDADRRVPRRRGTQFHMSRLKVSTVSRPSPRPLARIMLGAELGRGHRQPADQGEVRVAQRELTTAQARGAAARKAYAMSGTPTSLALLAAVERRDAASPSARKRTLGRVTQAADAATMTPLSTRSRSSAEDLPDG